MEWEFAHLIYDVKGRVCTITLNRPEKRNALSAALVNELIVALETAGTDDEDAAAGTDRRHPIGPHKRAARFRHPSRLRSIGAEWQPNGQRRRAGSRH